MRSQRGLWILSGIGLALILAGLLILPQLRKQASPATSEAGLQKKGDFLVPEPKSYYNLADGNALGKPDAPLTVTEFSDFQCPHCQNWARDVEPLFIAEFVETGKVRFVYRSMGDFLGPESLLAAEALYCADDQGAFWPYHDILFANPSRRPNIGDYSKKRLVGMAEALGLDTLAFQQCLDEHRYRDRAMQDQKDGLRFGVRGTPAFLFQTQDGRYYLMEGEMPIEAFRNAIQQLLGTSQ